MPPPSPSPARPGAAPRAPADRAAVASPGLRRGNSGGAGGLGWRDARALPPARRLDLLPATALRAQLAALALLGLDQARVERDVLAVIGAWPQEAEGLVPVAGYLQMWRSASALFGDPGLPTALGMAIPFGAFGVIDYLAGSADTLAGCINSVELHLAVVSPDTRLRQLPDGASCRLVVEVDSDVAPVVEEFTLAVLAGRMRALTTPAVQPEWVGLRAAAPAQPGVRERSFGAALRYGQPQTSMVLRTAELARPMHGADPYLHAVLERMARRPDGVGAGQGSALEQAIRVRLRDALGSGATTPGRLARLLGLSERTLQRRLAALGRSFSAIVEDFRREEAAHPLAGGRHALIEVAARLGYAEQSSFTRAFRRWYGTTPVQWRKTQA